MTKLARFSNKQEDIKKKKNTRPKTAGPGKRSYIPKLYPSKPRPKSAGFKAELTSSDLLYLTSETGYDEQEVTEWFKAFTKECPKGKLTRKKVNTCMQDLLIWQPLQMTNMYEKMGKQKAASLVDNILTIFDR